MRQSETKCSNHPTTEPTLPTASEDWIVFRESFLFYLEPEKRERLRAAGDVMFTQLLSGDVYRPPEPWTHARLLALVADLRFATQLLGEIAAEPLESHPEDPDENRLARQAASWAEEVARVAQAIEEGVRGERGDG